MSGQDLNQSLGLLIASVGLVSWLLVVAQDPHRHPIGAPVMLLLSLGMVLVSSLAVADESWWVGVFAAANRVIVAGSGIRALWHIRADARAGARREP